MSKPLSLDTWYGHIDHLQRNIGHSKWCGVCLIKVQPRKDVPASTREDIKFHNAEMAKAAGK